ncbi:hypothetical protein AA313_de0200801 [Arthrobotrys entomopaga]|nr:hypothetical protein AA313_de0200801 [Arthrobotrys entomopaga]
MVSSKPTATSKGRQLVPALMTPKHSVPIPAGLLDGYFSKLEPRVHCLNKDEEREINKVVQDWVRRGGRGHRHTAITPAGCILALTLPEADPKKLVDIAAISSFAFIEDDYMDGDMFRSKDIWKPGTPPQEQEAIRKEYGIILKQMKHKLFLELLEKDDAQNTYIQAYEGWAKAGIENNDQIRFDNLDTYLNDRMDNVAASVYYNLVPIVHDINLTKEDYDRLRCLDETVYQICILTNDLASVECDWACHATLEKPGLPLNYVCITMDIYNVTLKEAREMAIRKWQELEEKFLILREEIMSECSPASSDEYRRYISYLHYIAAGILVFSMHNPRYILKEDETPFFPRPEHTVADLPRKFKSRVVHNGITSKIVNGHTNKQDKMSNGIKRTLDLNGLENGMGPINSKRARLDENIAKPRDTSPWLRDYPDKLSDEIALEPFQYIKSLPSKGVRDAALDALDVWYRVPQKSVDIIKSVINMLHSSSLIIDDIEDNSPLRRGQPAAHMVYGTPQSINSANYLFVRCLDEVQKLGGNAVTIFTGQ